MDVVVTKERKTDYKSKSDTGVLTATWEQDGPRWSKSYSGAQVGKQEHRELHYASEWVRKHRNMEAASRRRDLEDPKYMGRPKADTKVQDTDAEVGSWVVVTNGWGRIALHPAALRRTSITSP